MKRRLLIHLPVFFLIGILFTYAVAWGCAIHFWTVGGYSAAYDSKWINLSDSSIKWLDCENSGSYGEFRAPGITLSKLGWRPISDMAGFFRNSHEIEYTDHIEYDPNQWIEISSDDLRLPLTVLRDCEVEIGGGVVLAGWPMQCLFAYHYEFRSEGKAGYPVFLDSLSWFQDPYGAVNLPYKPLWGRFILSSSIYGLLAFGLWLLPGPLKRRRRMRKGLCLQCKYDLRSDYDAGCPECGCARKSDAAEVSEAS